MLPPPIIPRRSCPLGCRPGRRRSHDSRSSRRASTSSMVAKGSAQLVRLTDGYWPTGGVGFIDEAEVNRADRCRIVVEQADESAVGQEGRLDLLPPLAVPRPGSMGSPSPGHHMAADADRPPIVQPVHQPPARVRCVRKIRRCRRAARGRATIYFFQAGSDLELRARGPGSRFHAIADKVDARCL